MPQLNEVETKMLNRMHKHFKDSGSQDEMVQELADQVVNKLTMPQEKKKRRTAEQKAADEAAKKGAPAKK